MGRDWDDSAEAWIASMGDAGDWGRQFVMDPVMLARVDRKKFHRALDVGCGEGRFCRFLRARGIDAIGIDPTRTLLEAAKQRDPAGDYRLGRAEQLDFPNNSFDLVVAYLTLVDIPDFRAAIREMTRVLAPGGTLLIANLTSFTSATCDDGWVMDEAGNRVHWRLDRYLDEFSLSVSWRGISITNYHRPLSAYMEELLAQNLRLTFFDEPEAIPPEWERMPHYRRAPWFLIMEWVKPT
jgi:SAM-dependent methyltransferase